LIALPMALMAMGDLRTGGFQSPAFNSLKTASLAVSLPLLIVFISMPFSLVKALRADKPPK
jgi:choline-glycine betaine transporter